MVFIELPIFIRCAAELFSDDDLMAMQRVLLDNPAAGDLIPGGKGLRKLRVPLTDKGKRGGARVIYYHWVRRECCYLVYAYAKSRTADLTRDQLQRLAKAIEAEVRNE